MKTSYETDFRPNFEAQQATIWALCGACSFLTLAFWTGVSLRSSFMFTVLFFIVAGRYAYFARGRQQRRKQLEQSDLSFLTMKDLSKQSKENSLYIGSGFDWSAEIAQKTYDLYQDHETFDSIRSNGKGSTFLHGLGHDKEGNIYLTDDESKGHVLIVGTTGAGKTRLFDLLVTQSIMRNEATIIIDPKGDRELMRNCEAAYERLGREDDFFFFHPAFPDKSCAIDPLANYQRESELASRIASIIPSDGKGGVFQSYGQNYLMCVFYGIIASGEPPTILDVHEPLTLGADQITYNALFRWAEKSDPSWAGIIARQASADHPIHKRTTLAIGFYKKQVSEYPQFRDTDLDGLINLFEHDRIHLSKMVASLTPVIGQLCAGDLKYLISPSYRKNRLPPSGTVIDLSSIIANGQGLYIGLDTLTDEIIGSRIGQLLLSDLTALAGKRYNFGTGKKNFVNIFVDETSEVVTDKLIQLLNKSRGAGFRVFLATQTLADFEAKTGSSAMADMITGNTNTTIMLRTLNPDTQESLSKMLPEVPIHYLMKTSATSISDTAANAAFSGNFGERMMHENMPVIAPQMFGDLTDLEYWARTPRGRLLKGRLPILEAPDDGDMATPSQFYIRNMLEGSRPYEPPKDEVDPLPSINDPDDHKPMFSFAFPKFLIKVFPALREEDAKRDRLSDGFQTDGNP